jgi:hypothetical protein
MSERDAQIRALVRSSIIHDVEKECGKVVQRYITKAYDRGRIEALEDAAMTDQQKADPMLPGNVTMPLGKFETMLIAARAAGRAEALKEALQVCINWSQAGVLVIPEMIAKDIRALMARPATSDDLDPAWSGAPPRGQHDA